jgi:hypothetical protein
VIPPSFLSLDFFDSVDHVALDFKDGRWEWMKGNIPTCNDLGIRVVTAHVVMIKQNMTFF